MAHENGLITAPVNTSDVCSTIGEDKHRVGYLCTSNMVNIYSKHKPMRHSTLSKLTDAQKILINWGYHVPNVEGLRTIMNNTISEEGGNLPIEWDPAQQDVQPYTYMHYGWWYQGPRGGSVTPISPYRLGDFDGYNHNTDERLWWTNDIPSVINGAFDVDLFGQININDANDVGNNPNAGSIGSLLNKIFLVGAIKTSSTRNSDLRFKSGPARPSGSMDYVRTIVRFTDDDAPLLFKDGEGQYYLYFFLVSQDDFENVYPNPIQNLDSTGTLYPMNTYKPLGDKMNECISLPIARKIVTYSQLPPTNPIGDFTFSLGSGGTITITASRGRITVNFPTLSATNTSSSQKSFFKGNLCMSVFLQKIDDSSKRWESTKYNMGLSGYTEVNGGATGMVFSSAQETFTDLSIIDFLNGDLVSDYLQSALIYYYDSVNDIYWDVATLTT